MQERLDIYLVLGCNGYAESKSWIMCHGVENPLVDLTLLSDHDYKTLVDFLDRACGLFDSQMSDYNKCVNTLNFIYKHYHAYDDVTLFRVQKFIKLHKDCGIWLALVLKEEFDG